MFLYPNKETLPFWIKLVLQSSNNSSIGISNYLPQIDKLWISRMLDVIERVRIQHYYQPETDLYTASAQIFYNICKLHGEIDGNKRSAVICVFLFLTLNYNEHLHSKRFYTVDGSEIVYNLAKRIASSKGHRFKKIHISRLADDFKKLMSK